jgi:uncharacterized membrane protein YhhN
MNFKDFSKIYFTLLLLHLVTIYRIETDVLHSLSKLLLIPSLGLYFWQYAQKNNIDQSQFIVAALFFSSVGDALLLKGDQNIFFLSGMAAFALAQIAYCWAHIKILNGNKLLKLIAVMAVGLGLAYLVLHFMAVPANLFLYVLSYAALLLMHFGLALLNVINGQLSSGILLGVFLFVLSDLLLALNKFGAGASAYLDVAVMLLYGLAQYLLVKGFISSPS